jgi:histidyl-tRNA synthetase
MKRPGHDLHALVPPAVAKWQFVEEKARMVLDSFCHREVRPPLLAPMAALDAMAAFAQAYVTHMPWQADPVTRWYSMGPAFRAETGPFGWVQGHEIAAVVFGLASASAEAEMVAMAGILLRDCGLPATQLRLTLLDAGPVDARGAGDSQHETQLFDALVDLGQKPHRGRGHGGHASHAGKGGFEITLIPPTGAAPLLLCGGQRQDEAIGHLGGPATPAIGWSIDLGQVVAALSDAAEGYQPPVSLLVAPLSEAAGKRALPLAQRLRAAGIRTEVQHQDLGPDEDGARARTRAERLGARLVVLVPDAPPDGALTLVDLASGQSRPIGVDDLEVRVAQLLD